MILLAALASFACASPVAHDGDTIRCASGTSIRLNGIEANELRGGCHLPVCPGMPAYEARDRLQAMIGGKTLRCTSTGRSYRRVTAWCRLPDGRDVSCLSIRLGIAVRWQRYDPEGRLRGCGR